MPVETEGVAMTQPVPVPTAPPPGDPAPTPTTDPTTDPAPTPAPTPPAPEPADQPLGPAGQRALAAERDARKALERQLAELAPLKELAAALTGGQRPADGKSEADLVNERIAQLEKAANDERAARWRLEVAQAKGLTAEQAAWIAGDSLEDLNASADRLLAAFPAAPAGPRTPAPDPSQGARGGQPGPDLQAQIAELQAKGDYWGAAALERSKLADIPRPR
jgi:hypothetical protein